MLEPHWPDSEQRSALSTALACTEQWRYVTDSNEPNFVNRSVTEVSNFKVSNVNKVDIFYGMILLEFACSSFRCTLSFYWQCIDVHSVTAAQSELNEALKLPYWYEGVLSEDYKRMKQIICWMHCWLYWHDQHECVYWLWSIASVKSMHHINKHLLCFCPQLNSACCFGQKSG